MHAAFNLKQLCSIHVMSDSSGDLVGHTLGRSSGFTI